MAGKKGRGPVRLVEPESLLGLNLGDVLLGLMETGEGQPGPAPDARPPRRRKVRCCGCACRTGGSSASRCSAASGVGTRRAGYAAPRGEPARGQGARLQAVPGRGGRALYAGALKAAGARAFLEAAPGGEFRYRNASLRRMTAGELAAAVDPGRVYDYDLLGAEG